MGANALSNAVASAERIVRGAVRAGEQRNGVCYSHVTARTVPSSASVELRACAKTGSDPLEFRGSDPVFAQALREKWTIVVSQIK
jgi:hypothetical protein